MRHDWKASAERLAVTLLGGTPDRVPLMYMASEDIAARISGLTIREMLASPQTLADVSVQVNEVLGSDGAPVVLNAYCGPYEGLALARANGRAELFEWKDYSTPFLREGKVCATEKDIENLEIPEHARTEPWPTILEAMALVGEKTGLPHPFAPSLTWSSVQMLRGSQAYLDVIENPELLLMLCEKIYASQWDYFEAFCRHVGRPASVYNCQYAFNRHMLRFEDAWRFEGQFVNRLCKEADLPLAIHNCGFDPYWVELVERHASEGVRVIAVNGSHPLDLDEWVRFRQRFPEIVIIGASLWVNGELEHGQPGDVQARVRENIEKLGPSGRLIIAPVCCMPWRVPLANIFAVREAVEKYGRYPIQAAG
jgi:uroporphyrinogen-III decarboxylase